MHPWTRWLIGCAAALLAQPVWAVHFDVLLDTDPGPVAGARLTIGFHGDAVVGSDLPIDYATGQMIYPGAFEPWRTASTRRPTRAFRASPERS